MENHPEKQYNHNTIWLWSWLINSINYMWCWGGSFGGVWAGVVEKVKEAVFSEELQL